MISGRELANSNPDTLKKELGIVGLDLFFHANGIDESNVHKSLENKVTWFRKFANITTRL